MSEEHYGKFIFKLNMLSIILNHSELSHELVLKKIRSIFYARLFDESEEGPFEDSPDHTNVGVIRKSLPGAPKLYVFQDNKIACVFC